MVKQIQARELIKSEEFIREPVDILSKKISTIDSKRIILSGGRGTGKSVVLYNSERKGIGNENQTIFMSFDPIVIFPDSYNETFNEQFVNHYYEINFCWNLLNYIKRNYSLTYEAYFKGYEHLLKDISDKTYEYINNYVFGKITFNSYIRPTSWSNSIIKDFKLFFNIDSLTLAIDRFDWINGGSANVQNILCNFFDMFDKVVITTDDETLQNKDNRKKLINKGYSFIDINYGKNKLVIKEIIRKRIQKYNESKKASDLIFSEDIITDQIYQNLINNTNGNIDCMLKCIYGVICDWEWEKGNIDLAKSFTNQTHQQLTKIKELKKIDGTPPKLHL